ncbi:hypothetical protein FV226_14285 [Methylobacterium sp. WL12]|uniref:hypothetical protein n=1 Tax=Methylobacterium sp. WL12 TaxID=2603890 RepID=UPI0011C7A4BD|nr:hypothetical protein [Methylobacterium sp. WL12]TXM71676.1 hypothetical protein FV226_14285 [Methylobacterium sp. WL12]
MSQIANRSDPNALSDVIASDDELIPHVTRDPDTGLPWPEPTCLEPDFVALALFLFDACAEATDGCLVEPDGTCVHGHPSWLKRFGVI